MRKRNLARGVTCVLLAGLTVKTHAAVAGGRVGLSPVGPAGQAPTVVFMGNMAAPLDLKPASIASANPSPILRPGITASPVQALVSAVPAQNQAAAATLRERTLVEALVEGTESIREAVVSGNPHQAAVEIKILFGEGSRRSGSRASNGSAIASDPGGAGDAGGGDGGGHNGDGTSSSFGDPLVLKGHAGMAVWQVEESPDGKYLASVGADGTAIVWDARTGKALKEIVIEDASNLFGVGWASDGKLMVASWHARSGKTTSKANGSSNKVRYFDVGGRRKRLGIGDALREVRIPGAYTIEILGAAGGSQSFAATVQKVVDGKYKDASVRFFNGSGRRVAEIKSSELLDVRGQLALIGAPLFQGTKLEVWDIGNARRPRNVTPSWITERIKSGDWKGSRSRDLSVRLGIYQNRQALICARGGEIQFLDLATGALLRKIEVPNAWVAGRRLATDPSGKWLAADITPPGAFAGYPPENLVVWNLETGETALLRDATGGEFSVSFTEGRHRLIAAGPGQILVFDSH